MISGIDMHNDDNKQNLIIHSIQLFSIQFWHVPSSHDLPEANQKRLRQKNRQHKKLNGFKCRLVFRRYNVR